MATTAEWQPTACVLCACNCGIEVQVEGSDDHAASKATGRTPLEGLRVREGSAARVLPGQSAAHRRRCGARRAAPTKRSTGTRRSPRSLPASRASATSTEARRSSTTAAAARATISAAHTPARPAPRWACASPRTRSRRRRPARSGSTRISSATSPHTAPDFERARGGGLRRQEPVAGARHPARAAHAQGDRRRPGADPDRHRSAPHRNGRPRRHPSPGQAGRRRVPAFGDARRCSCRRTCVDHAFLEAHTQHHEEVLEAVAEIDVDAYCRRAGVEPALARAAARADRHSRERLDPGGPGHPAGPALDAQLVSGEAAVGADRQLRAARLHEPAHAVLAGRARRTVARVRRRDPGHRRTGDRAACSRPRRSPTPSSPTIRPGSAPPSSRAATRCTRCPTPRACAKRWRRWTSAS